MNSKRSFAVVALSLVLAACSESNTQELKVHHLMPPRAPTHTKFIVPWCEKIEKESDLPCDAAGRFANPVV